MNVKKTNIIFALITLFIMGIFITIYINIKKDNKIFGQDIYNNDINYVTQINLDNKTDFIETMKIDDNDYYIRYEVLDSEYNIYVNNELVYVSSNNNFIHKIYAFANSIIFVGNYLDKTSIIISYNPVDEITYDVIDIYKDINSNYYFPYDYLSVNNNYLEMRIYSDYLSDNYHLYKISFNEKGYPTYTVIK